MPTFTVHVPPDIADDGVRAERTIFVRDGFDWGAFLFGPLGLLYHGLWRATLAWLAAAAVLFAVAVAFGLGGFPRLGLYLVLAVLTGLEASEARRRALGRGGFIPAGLMCGVTRDAGERAFFDALRPFVPPAPARPAGRGPQAARARAVIGLFPPAGGRA